MAVYHDSVGVTKKKKKTTEAKSRVAQDYEAKKKKEEEEKKQREAQQKANQRRASLPTVLAKNANSGEAERYLRQNGGQYGKDLANARSMIPGAAKTTLANEVIMREQSKRPNALERNPYVQTAVSGAAAIRNQTAPDAATAQYTYEDYTKAMRELERQRAQDRLQEAKRRENTVYRYAKDYSAEELSWMQQAAQMGAEYEAERAARSARDPRLTGGNVYQQQNADRTMNEAYRRAEEAEGRAAYLQAAKDYRADAEQDAVMQGRYERLASDPSFRNQAALGKQRYERTQDPEAFVGDPNESLSKRPADMLVGEKKEIFYALYAQDPQKAQEYAEYTFWKDYQAEMDKAFAWAGQNPLTRGTSWELGRRLGQASGFQPFTTTGRMMAMMGQALSGGSAQGLQEHGLLNMGDTGKAAQLSSDPYVRALGRRFSAQSLAGTLPEDIEVIGGDGPVAQVINKSISALVGGKGLADVSQLASSMLTSYENAMLTGAFGMLGEGMDPAQAENVAKVGEAIGLALMGSSAAASDYAELMAKGVDQKTAMLHATAAGVAEAAFEKLSLENIINMRTDGGLKQLLENWFVQAGVEASEETFTSMANRVTDEIIMDTNGYYSAVQERQHELLVQGVPYAEAKAQAEREWLVEILNDALGGFLSGGGMTAMNTVQGGIANIQERIEARNERNTMREWIGSAAANEQNAELQAALDQYAKDNKLKGYDQAQIEQVREWNRQQSQQATEEAQSTVKSEREVRRETARGKKAARNVGKVTQAVLNDIEQKTRGKVMREYEADLADVSRRYKGLADTVRETAYNASSDLYGTAKSVRELDTLHKDNVQGVKNDALRQAAISAYNDRMEQLAPKGSRADARWRARQAFSNGALDLSASYGEGDGRVQTQIDGITEDGKKIKLANGEVKTVDELELDADTQDILTMLTTRGLGSVANNVLAEYQAQVKKGDLMSGYGFATDFIRAVEYGRTNQKLSDVQAALKNIKDKRTVEVAWKLGREQAQKQAEAGRRSTAAKAQTGRKASYQTVEELLGKEPDGGGVKSATGRKGSVDVSRIKGMQLDAAQTAQVQMAKTIARAIGVDVSFFASEADENGRYHGAQGSYRNGVIELDINAGRLSTLAMKSGILKTMSHELTHFIQDYSADLYQELKDFAFLVLGEKAGVGGIEELIDEKVARSGEKISRQDAEDEVIADAMETMLGSSEAVKQLYAQNATLADKVLSWLADFMRTVKAAIGPADHREAKIIDELDEQMRKVFQDKWDTALADAANRLASETGNEKTAREGGKHTQKSERAAQNFERDSEYLELAKDPEKNRERLQEMVDEAAREAGYTYRRNTRNRLNAENSSGSPIRMFVLDADGYTDLGNYGKYRYTATDAGALHAADILDDLLQLARDYYEENGIETSDLTEESVNPSDIVMSAMMWDDADFVQYAWDNYFEAVYDRTDQIPALETEDGLIVFGDDNARIKSLDPVTYDDDGNVIPLSERFNPEKEDIRYSERDSDGRELSEGQREFFKDSKVRDKDGNLLVLYRGKRGGETVIHGDYRGAIWTTTDPEFADRYGVKDELYANIKNPYYKTVYNTDSDTGYDIDQVIHEAKSGGHDGAIISFTLNQNEYTGYVDYAAKHYPNEPAEEILKGWAKSAYMDAHKGETIGEFWKRAHEGPVSQHVVVFSSEQIKRTDNQNPTVHPDIRFSERDESLLSDYEIALEADPMTAAKNEEQRRMLTEVQDRIRKVQELQRKLAKARRDAENLDGGAKTEKQNLAKDLQKQINKLTDTIDKNLNSAHLHNLLKEQRKAQRERTMGQYRENRKRQELRGRIKNLHAEMQRDLLKPREGHFVPQSLIRPVVDLLDLVNTQTNRAKSEDAQARIDAINRAYDQIRKDERYSQYYDETVKDMLVELSSTLAGRSIYDLNSDELADVYTAVKAMRTTIRNTIKADLIEKGKQIWEIGNSLRQELRSGKGASPYLLEKYHMSMLSAERAFHRFGGYRQNSTWDKVYRMLDDAQLKMLNLEMQATRIFDPVLKAKADFKQAEALTSTKEKDLVDVGLKDADGNAVKITRGMMLSLYMHLQNEENMRHLMYGGLTLPDFKLYYNGNSEAWGRGTVEIPALGAKVSNLDELLETDGEVYVDEKYKEYQDEIREMYESVRSAIEDELTDYDRKWIAASKEFFDEFSRQALNATTNAMYGFSKAKVDNYFPIVTDSNFLKSEFDSISRNISLENAGFMKERVKAGNPILLEDITKAVNRQISNVSRYAGLTQALKTFGNVYNVQTKGFADSVKKAMAKSYGKNGQEYIQNLITDMIGGRSQPVSIFDRIKGNVAQAVLSANLSVMIKQAASFPTAAATVGWGPIMKALAKGGRKGRVISRADRTLIDTYSPLLWKRSQGAIDTEIGDMAHAQDWTKKAKWLMGWIEKTDIATVGRLWYAAEYYVKSNFDLEKGTEAQIKAGESPFYQKVAEVFNQIVEDTQPNYTVLQRPDILRNPNKLVRAMTMFSTQRFQNANILIDAVNEYAAMVRYDKKGGTEQTKAARKAAKTKLTRAISSQVVSAVVLNAMTLLAGALMHRMNPWRDDDDELTAASVAEEYLNGFVSSMAGSFLGGAELYEAISSMLTGSKYYGNDVGGISTVSELATAIVEIGQQAVKLIGDEDSKPEDWKKLAEKQLWKVGEYLSQMTGVPASNIRKIIEGGKNHITDIINGEFGSFEAGLDRANATNGRRYYKAWMSGDTEKMADVLDELTENVDGDEDKARNAINKAFKTAYDAGELSLTEYTRFITESGLFDEERQKGKIRDLAMDSYNEGTMTEDEAIRFLTDSGFYDENAAWKKVQEWAAKSEHEDDEDYSYSQYDAIDQAIDANNDIKDLVQHLTDHGVEEKNISDHVKKYLVERYVNGDVTEQALKNQLSRYLGITVTDDVNKILKDANSKKQYGVAYSSLDEEYRAGNISPSELKSALMKYGNMTSADADKKIRWYDLQKSKPDLDISEANCNNWYDGTSKSRENGHEGAKAAGMSIEAYLRAKETLSQIKDTNDNGTGEDEYIAALAKMNLPARQKDALYYEKYKGTTKYSNKKW